jgi:hypothetical protein
MKGLEAASRRGSRCFAQAYNPLRLTYQLSEGTRGAAHTACQARLRTNNRQLTCKPSLYCEEPVRWAVLPCQHSFKR